jgi:oligopeptidase B
LGKSEDALLYEEEDERFRVRVRRSRSRAFLYLASDSLTTSEARFLPAADPTAPLTLVAPRQAEHEYEVDHHGDLFYIRTNSGGRNFRLVTAPVADPRQEGWREILPHRADVMIAGLDLFAGHAVLYEREDALPQIHILDLRSGASHRVAFPEPVYTCSPAENAEFETSLLRLNYQSFMTPPSVFDYGMESRQWTLLKEEPVLGGYDRTQYRSERAYATAEDGTRVPISLVYRTDQRGEGPRPLFLSGYGSYGHPNFATFSSRRLSLLDRGVIVAIAHVRGGGEGGKPWHDAGRMLRKRNTFTDFIACAERLIDAGFLMGAIAQMRPDLFRAIVSYVPFVDVINTMSDASLPLTVGEFEEWGNPQVAAEYAYIRSYCPYSNLCHQAYPTLLVKTSLNDSQVMYWEPAKYVAKMRALKTDANLLLLKTNMAGGHGGHSGRYDALREVAFDYAFVLWQLGIAD